MPAYVNSAATFVTTGGTQTVSITPAVGNLLVVFGGHSGTNAGDAGTVTDNQGGTYTQVRDGVGSPRSSGGEIAVYVRDRLVSAAVSHTITLTAPTGDTGGGPIVVEVSGMSRAGIGAIRAVGNQNTGGSGTTPTVPLVGPYGGPSTAALNTNMVLACCSLTANPGSVTVPSGFTQRQFPSYSVPTTSAQVSTIDSGFSGGATVTWGGTASTTYCACAIELDGSPLPQEPTVQLAPLIIGPGGPIVVGRNVDLEPASGGSTTTVGVSVAGQITFTGQQVGLSTTVSPTAGQITFTGQAVGLRIAVPVSTAGAITVTGGSVAFTTTVPVSTAGQITFTGQQVGLRTTVNVGTAGAITFTGQTITTIVATVVSVTTAGAITLTGQAVALQVTAGVSTAGQITFTGQQVGVTSTANVGTAGAITFTGQQVGLKITVPVSTAGAITFTGGTVAFGGATTVNVSTAGAITVTGGSVAFRTTAGVSTAGAIGFTGQTVGAVRAVPVSTAGAITFTGQTVGLKVTTTINVDTAGAIAFMGQTVGLIGTSTPPLLIETFEGILAGGAAAGAILILSGAPNTGGAAAGAVLVETADGVTAGGAPSGAVLVETADGPLAGGGAAGTVLIETARG